MSGGLFRCSGESFSQTTHRRILHESAGSNLSNLLHATRSPSLLRPSPDPLSLASPASSAEHLTCFHVPPTTSCLLHPGPSQREAQHLHLWTGSPDDIAALGFPPRPLILVTLFYRSSPATPAAPAQEPPHLLLHSSGLSTTNDDKTPCVCLVSVPPTSRLHASSRRSLRTSANHSTAKLTSQSGRATCCRRNEEGIFD